MKSALLLTACLSTTLSPALFAQQGIEWHDVTTWGVEGRILPDAERLRWFDRLPAAAQKEVTGAVWNLSRDSAGMMTRFTTDATAIHVKYRLRDGGLVKEGITGLHYIEGDHLYGDDSEGATDASHANDLGFMRQADVFEPVLRKALEGSP